MYIPAHRNLPLFSRPNDFLKPKHALINRAVNVFFTEGFRRWPKHRHLSSTSCNLKRRGGGCGGKKELVKLPRTHRVRTHTYVSAGFIRHGKILVPATDWSWQTWVDCSRDQFVELEMSAYGILEALDVRCQNRILSMRHSLDSSEYVSVVCHLHEGNDKWCLKKRRKKSFISSSTKRQPRLQILSHFLVQVHGHVVFFLFQAL